MDSSWVSKVEGPVVMRKNAGGSSEYYYLQTGGSNDPNIYRSSSLKEKGAVVGTMTGYDDWWCSMMASYGDDIYIGTGAAIFKMDASHNVSLFHVVTEEEKEDPLGNQWGDKLRLFGISVSGDVLSYDMKLYPEDSDRVGGHAIRLTDGTFFAPTATPTPATWLADVGTPTPTPYGGNNTTVTPTPTKGATATPIPADYPDWTEGVNYQVGDIVKYQGKTYRCTRAIPGQAGWDPVTLLGSFWEEYDAPAPTATPTVTNTPAPTATSTPVPTSTSTPTPTPTWAYVSDGWFNDGEGWTYYNNGDIVTGWIKSGGKWYFLSKETGYMQTGWIKDGGKWYFLDKKTGAMKTGWIKDGSAWYHTDKNGVMQSSKWISDGGKWYYVGKDGKMVAGKTITIGGVSYTFDKNGVWQG